jgi:hypothetical protein
MNAGIPNARWHRTAVAIRYRYLLEAYRRERRGGIEIRS